MKIKSLWFMSIAAILLAGCSSTPPLEKKQPVNNDDDDDDDDNRQAPPNVAPNSVELVSAVSSFFREKCVDCHGGNGNDFGGLRSLFDVQALKDNGLISATADGSRLFNKVKGLDHAEGKTNPRTLQNVFLPNDQEINFLRLWIDAGAPDLRGNRSPIGVSEYLSFLRLGVSQFPRPEQAELVVVDFRSVYNNNRFSDAELSSFVNATIKLVNQLDVRSGSANGADFVIVTEKQNNLPLGVVFNPQSFNLDKQQDIINTIVRLDNRQDPNDPFDCDIPSIPALDFIHIASSDDVFNPIQDTFESGYSNIAIRRLLEDAGIAQPGQLVFDAISAQQFIDFGFTNKSANFNLFDLLEAIDPKTLNRDTLDTIYNKASDDERVVRGCMLNSNVSAANRCIDRYTLSTGRGNSAWISWDVLSFENANQNKNFFQAAFVGPGSPANDPLVKPQDGTQPFVVDGGELIFQLKNQMMGFGVFNGAFEILSNPPTEAVLNLDNLERGSEIGASACVGCHSAYSIPFKDVVLPSLFAGKNGLNFEEAGFAFKFSQPQDVWNNQFSLDAQYYTEALRKIYFAKGEGGELADGIWSLGKQYMNDLTIEDVIAELGIADEEILFDAIDNNTDLTGDLLELLGAFGIGRESLTINWPALVRQVATGNEEYLFGCIQVEVSDAGDTGDNDDGTNNGSNDGNP